MIIYPLPLVILLLLFFACNLQIDSLQPIKMKLVQVVEYLVEEMKGKTKIGK